MKILPYAAGLFLLLFAATCNGTDSQEPMEMTGTIEESGITSYQYGTHILSNESKFYAIKSDAVDLQEYVGENVTVEYTKIEGYPVDGGPEYLEILSVK